ncbi:helix-turn-helix domain-containing protein [Actinobacillus genomosp. 2]|uniref:helix-turn-helix transcriptional regulator n=1 Tax=Actinobacillus TaxID=713 RepID=UPI00244307BE|nr:MULTISPECIES: helix-turn-helix transcriptional regulator [Actinobacillus]WGE31666.1 helix-turn-helix domain-containing protein [Actinobacillus genomosp. 2]WGE90891.1 helix-turn-helix domain-containing protein [Actinobacillus genomosp. 1]
MTDINLLLEEQIDALKTLQKQLLVYEQAKKQQLIEGKIEDLTAFGQQLNQKRKALNIDLYTLELQTNISSSTLKRLFQDPSQVRFSTVLLVAKTLGVSLCAV